jgi:hypothetical protein
VMWWEYGAKSKNQALRRKKPPHEKTPQIVGRVSSFWGAVHR